MILLSANNANTELGAGITSGATLIVLTTGTGALFPNPTGGEYFTLTLNDALTGLIYEVCWCTARTGDNLTVIRGQEGTSARAWIIGDFAYNTDTANSIQTARAFSATNTPTLPFTVPAAHQGITQLCAATGTLTLPNVSGIQDGFLCPIVCTSGSATITINTNSSTVVLPTGNVTTSFTISGLDASLFLQWNALASVWYLAAGSPSLYPPPSGMVNQTAAGSYTFTVPASVFSIKVTVKGGGGHGASCQASAGNISGSGGGEGGTSIGYFAVTPGQIINYSVGAGGIVAGAAAGFSDVSIGTTPTGFGGSNALFASTGSSAGGAGGTASGGTYNVSGGYGSDGQNGSFILAGNGGGSGGRAGQAMGEVAPQGSGSGGGGAYDATGSSTVFPGGNGGSGFVIIEW